MADANTSDALQVFEEKDTLRIGFPPIVDVKVAQKFTAESTSWLLGSAKMIVFDFAATTKIKNAAYRAFVNFHQLIAKSEIGHESWNLNTAIQKQVKADGLFDVFNPVAKTKGKASSKNPFDLTLANAFCEATKKTLEVQAQMKVTILKPKLVKIDDKTSNPDVSIAGVLNLATEKFNGSLTIAFTSATFLKVYERMVGETHTEISAEIEDAAGEILNIIYGTAKSELNQLPGYNLQPMLPTIMSGEKLKIRQRTNQLIVQLPFESDLGTFFVEIAVQSAADKAAA